MAQKKKKRKNFMFPADLVQWAEKYAEGKHTSLTQIFTDHLMNLRRESEAENVEQI